MWFGLGPRSLTPRVVSVFWSDWNNSGSGSMRFDLHRIYQIARDNGVFAAMELNWGPPASVSPGGRRNQPCGTAIHAPGVCLPDHGTHAGFSSRTPDQWHKRGDAHHPSIANLASLWALLFHVLKFYIGAQVWHCIPIQVIVVTKYSIFEWKKLLIRWRNENLNHSDGYRVEHPTSQYYWTEEKRRPSSLALGRPAWVRPRVRYFLRHALQSWTLQADAQPNTKWDRTDWLLCCPGCGMDGLIWSGAQRFDEPPGPGSRYVL
jgi:hypothetical protein